MNSPYEQGYFRKKGWSRLALAGTLQPLATMPTRQYRTNEQIIDDLRVLAVSRIGNTIEIYPYFAGTVTYNGISKAKGACLAKGGMFIGLRLYYHDAFDGAVAMAHEVGHLHTMNREAIGQYNSSTVATLSWERLASRWALAWLRGRLNANDLDRAERLLNAWLDSYYECYRVIPSDREHVHAGEPGQPENERGVA